MHVDEDDLYAVALGSDYSSGTNQPSTSSAKPVEEAEISTANAPDYAALFRKLLVGSRSQINQLKAENKQLKENLENAISSGGVVICPNCTHHFKDRQCPLRPRAMKKMRARNCVELEFSTEEDLTAWLFLNQLETNNDGLPTVMKMKTADAKEKSLEDVGSLLPSLVEKRNETKKEVRRSPIKLKIKKDNLEKMCTSSVEQKKDLVQEKHELARKETSVKKTRIESQIERKETKASNEKSKKRDHKTLEASEKKREPSKRGTETRKDGERSIKTAETRNGRMEERKKPISERLGFPTAKRAHSPSEQNATSGPKRAIVWEEPSAAKVTAKQFEFKIPEKKTVPKVSVVSSKTTKPKQKITFVPTSQKKLSQAAPRVSQLTKEPSFAMNEIPTEQVQTSACWTHDEGQLITEQSTSAEERKNPTWGLIPVKKSEAVVQHIEDHALRRRSEPRVSLSNDYIPNRVDDLQSSTNQDNEFGKDAEKNAQIAGKLSTLKMIGVSEEGIVALEQQLRNTPKDFNSASKNVKLSVGDLNRIFCNSAKSKRSPNGCSAPSRVPAETPSPAKVIWGKNNRKHKAVMESWEAVTLTESVPQTHQTQNSSQKSAINLDKEDQDLLDEFFPSICNELARKTVTGTSALPAGSLGNLQSAQTDTDSETVSLVDDREENELMSLVREESVVPPNGDFLEQEDLDRTIVQQNEQDEGVGYGGSARTATPNSDYEDFCLEDVKDFTSETMCEREFSSSSGACSSRASEETMDWMNDMEKLEDNAHEEEMDENFGEDYSGVNPLEESNLAEPSESQSIGTSFNNCIGPKSSKGEFCLSDDEELISRMTSTPKRKDAETDDEVFKPLSREDSFVDELDWDYDVEEFINEEEKQEEHPKNEADKKEDEAPVESEKTIDNGKNGENREDGEISDEEVKTVGKVEKSPKKHPMRERIRFVVDQKQVDVEVDEENEEHGLMKECDKRRSDQQPARRSSRHYRRRSSEENQDRLPRREIRRSRDRSSLLKHRN